MGYCNRNSVRGVEDRRRGNVRLVCHCREVRGDRDRCGCCRDRDHGWDHDRRGSRGGYSDWCGCSRCERERDRRRDRHVDDFVCRCRERR